MAKEAIGFGREARVGGDEEAIKRLFTPEFRNRLDATITFAGLTPEIWAGWSRSSSCSSKRSSPTAT